ncbi:LPS export ABC transporter periplasmic protein LptC [Pedobacter gandavensis]|uniref:LPS export ABC transporter periplasmic protein LptC n=1 Tax=Pedobacter gandavensis TaxID=2679963 RepID=A0ABR6EXE1_9SPHI|nr:LPS export ABC transporter periplasmic protein LptC [Pedobacter gandavensis]MBB2149957.1 hypothetical protein [Pedobacter gandavensis]
MKSLGITTGLAVLCLFQLCLSSCGDDDLKKAAPLAKNELIKNRDRTIGVEIIYSDSAVVKAKGTAPIMDKITPKNGATYQEMPEGVKINFLNDSLKVKGSIVSDYAISKDVEKIIIFKRNVVVVDEQMTFNTEELTWDQNKHMFYSPKGVITKPDGTVINAVNFSAKQDFSVFNFEQGFGETYVDKNFGE